MACSTPCSTPPGRPSPHKRSRGPGESSKEYRMSPSVPLRRPWGAGHWELGVIDLGFGPPWQLRA
jgi:hypothetical protein